MLFAVGEQILVKGNVVWAKGGKCFTTFMSIISPEDGKDLPTLPGQEKAK